MTLTQSDTKVSIVPFKKKYAPDFARLNYEWLVEFFEPEEHDREMLDHPKQYIIRPGGQIFFAKVGDQMAGTVALIEDGTSFELAKMSVSQIFRGQKLGNLLMLSAIEYSKQCSKDRIWLDSNTRLEPALNLYKKYGFKEIPTPACTPYARCNVRMELML